MEEKLSSSQYMKSRILNSPNITRLKTSQNSINDPDRINTEKNLRNKLDNAFSDLDSLRKALKDIKYKSDSNFASNKEISNYNHNHNDYNNYTTFANKDAQFSPRIRHESIPNNDFGERNGGSISRSNSNSKSYIYYNNEKNRNDRKSHLTPKGNVRINTKTLFNHLNDNMLESEKILLTHNIQQKMPRTTKTTNDILSPTRSIYTNRKSQENQYTDNFFSSMVSNNLNNQTDNSTNFVDLNNSSQINSNPLYNFRKRLGSFGNNFSYKSVSKLNNTVTNANLNPNVSSNDINKTVNNQTNINLNNSLNKSSSTTIVQNVSMNTLKEENERLKMSINVINKSNLDLKNQVRLLQIELSAVNSSNMDTLANRLDQDPQLLHFLENMKAALSSSQNSNSELTSLFDNLQKKNSDLTKENLILKEQYELISKELESITKRFNESRYTIDELSSDLRKIENEKTILILHKNDFEEKYKLSEEKVNNLVSINESHIKCKNDNMEMIENLKQTIEALRRSGENETNKSLMLEKVDQLETLVQEKSYSIQSMSSKLKNFENDREYFNQELKIMEKEFKDKNTFIEELQQKYHLTNTEFEKCKSRIEALLINISERDQTINNLKTSMSFISGTIEDYKLDYEKIRTQTDGDCAEKSKLIKELELAQKKVIDISSQFEAIILDKETLQKRNIDIENELNEKKNNLAKLSFENEILKQKLENNSIYIEQIQEDMRNSKFSKINEEFQNEITKSNEERNKRLKEIEKQIQAKNKIIEELQKEIRDVTASKDEKINEIQILLNKRGAAEKELEYRMNDKVNELKNDIEISKQEILLFKADKERERSELQYEINKYKADFDNLTIRYKALEIKYNDATGEKYSNVNKNVGNNSGNYSNFNNLNNLSSNNYSNYPNNQTGNSTFNNNAFVTGSSPNNNFKPNLNLNTNTNIKNPTSYNYQTVSNTTDKTNNIIYNSNNSNINPQLSNFNYGQSNTNNASSGTTVMYNNSNLNTSNIANNYTNNNNHYNSNNKSTTDVNLDDILKKIRDTTTPITNTVGASFGNNYNIVSPVKTFTAPSQTYDGMINTGGNNTTFYSTNYGNNQNIGGNSTQPQVPFPVPLGTNVTRITSTANEAEKDRAFTNYTGQTNVNYSSGFTGPK